MIRFVTAVAVFIALLAVAACSPADDNSTVTDNNEIVADNITVEESGHNSTELTPELHKGRRTHKIVRRFGSEKCGKTYVGKQTIKRDSGTPETIQFNLEYPPHGDYKKHNPIVYAEVTCWQKNTACNYMREVKFTKEEVKIYVEAWRVTHVKCVLKVYSNCV
ncbi:unnamed protein product [Hermetia illucens]|uniref:Secreted protein n=1 Tax=Hermetia illucens TaxID=343691 RepID=A0A7R8V2P1_HERIL|nr:uncharacterized protein LOC119657858 [Hermetia illucens]CAD7090550.1 unnamed protein product [Hermetia illucens]